MVEINDGLKVALGEVADFLLGEDPVHPSAEKIFEEARGALPKRERAELQNHYSICEACARLRLELPRLVAGERKPIETEQQVRALERLEREVGREHGSTSAAVALKAPRRRRAGIYAVAATVFVAVSVGWFVVTKAPVDPAPAPEVNIPTLSLSVGPDRTRGSIARSVDASLGFQVVVPLSGARSDVSYRVRLTSSDSGRILWTSPPTRHSRGEITLTFRPNELKPGFYELEVLESANGQERSLGKSVIRVVES